MKSTNSHGNTAKEVRKWLRSQKMKTDVATVERVGAALRKTQAENERDVARSKEIERETGRAATFDGRGAVEPRVRALMERKLAERDRRR